MSQTTVRKKTLAVENFDEMTWTVELAKKTLANSSLMAAPPNTCTDLGGTKL